MRRFALLLLLAPIAGFGQSLVTITPENCVWRAGDEVGHEAGGAPHWATPDLDESGWKPYAQWNLNPDTLQIWVRCHADLSALQNTAHPAVQVAEYGAYDLFVNGIAAGSNGDLRSGSYTLDAVRTFPLLSWGSITSKTLPGQSVIALRLRFGSLISSDPLHLRVGEEEWLKGLRDSQALAGGASTAPAAIAFGAIGVAGIFLLGLYLSDRDRHELLMLAIICWSLAALRLDDYLESSLAPITVGLYAALNAFGNIHPFFYTFFVFRIGRKPVPLVYLILGWADLFFPAYLLSIGLLPAEASLHFAPFWQAVIVGTTVVATVLFLAPFVAFRHWRRVPGMARYSAVCTTVWGLTNAVWTLTYGAAAIWPTTGTWLTYLRLHGLLQARAVTTIAAIVALVALLFLDQRRTARERTMLGAELSAAREVQQRLVPATLPEIAGYRIAAAYLPAAEVGGDFYQVLVQSDDSTLIVVGDVSGKGLKAAMTGALAIGAIRTLAAEGLGPAELLGRLNGQIVEAKNEGFITCICARLDGAGMTIANAGHLSPYRNGEEVVVDSGFPLGIVAGAEYGETVVTLAAGDRMTFLSDGVLEARAEDGALLGFERMAELSIQSAAEIAQAAQAFGQDDDITVLTLARVGA